MNNSRNNSRRQPSNRAPRKKQVSSINPLDLVKKASNVAQEVFVSKMKYEDFDLNADIKRNLKEKGFERPTQIQEESIPQLIEGKNLIGVANTGTGKTGAFLIPILEQIKRGDRKLQALIVLPTRELALQVEEEFKSLAKGLDIKASSYIGGTNVAKDVNKLKNRSEIVIGTPGRLLDLMNQGALRLGHTSVLVLDEFDKMLDMGFVRDIEKLIDAMKNRKQTLLFSATIDKKQDSLIRRIVENPIKVKVNTGLASSDKVDQDIIRVSEGEDKFDLLAELLAKDNFDKVLVFTETKHVANKVAKKLNSAGIQSDMIHGNKSQNYRIKALDKFKKGTVRVLVATDVAARGIDVANVSHVINYQLPMNMDSYIHRIGRTGRAGQKGQAYTFID